MISMQPKYKKNSLKFIIQQLLTGRLAPIKASGYNNTTGDACSDGKNISGKRPESIREKILTGTHMKISDEEFDKVMVCLYGEANKEFTINPKEFSEYWNTVNLMI